MKEHACYRSIELLVDLRAHFKILILLSLYRYTTNPLFGEDYHDEFDPQAYLQTYFTDDTDPVQRFKLKQLHKFYQSYKLTETKLKILDIGTGPVIAHAISAAPYASEIVLSEYTEANRKELLQWLKNDPKAYDWTPFFKHVVVDLEGKSEEEVPVRAELVRKVIKAVVPCDVRHDPPIPAHFVGQYDIITDFFCLSAACATKEDYLAGLVKLCALLKPGGKIVLCLGEGKDSSSSYAVGSLNFSSLLLSKESVCVLLKQAGFCDVKIVSLARNEFPTVEEYLQARIGFNFVTACKTN